MEEHKLHNGMRAILVLRPSEPSLAAGWVAHVGSVNEPAGQTGLTHLLEHMLSKGTAVIGTRDFRREQPLLIEQDRLQAQMAKLDTPDAKLEQLFRRSVKAQQALLVKNEFHEVYLGNGAVELNAHTDHDTTSYVVTLPPGRLELWCLMESERILHTVFREFYTEREVVLEERHKRIESTPLGKAQEAFRSLLWGNHPYGHPVSGWPAEVQKLQRAQAEDYFRRYYTPANITLVLVGDLQRERALALLGRYFARIPAGAGAPPPLNLPPTQVDRERRLRQRAETPPRLEIGFHTVPFRHPDTYPLQLLAQLLDGRSGRLFRAVVRGGAGGHAEARQVLYRYAGTFTIVAEAGEHRPIEPVEKAVFEELARLAVEPIEERELQKVKNQAAMVAVQRLTSNRQILDQLLRFEGLGDYREINEELRRLQTVTAADVKRVAQKYFASSARTVAVLSRTAGGEP